MPDKTLFVVIPAYNEGKTIADVVGAVPRKIKGIEEVKVLVVDDGSEDDTCEHARKAGADIVHSLGKNMGLAFAFNKGVELALEGGADIVVSIDADMQYEPAEIADVIEPILNFRADVVLTDRGIQGLAHMPAEKRLGNLLATWVVKKASGFRVLDGQSGFRAFTRDGAKALNIQSGYTYVGESIIQWSRRGFRIEQVPCSFNSRDGSSRLIKNVFTYACRGGSTIVRTYLRYSALKSFIILGGLMMFAGALPGVRFMYYFITEGGMGHIQSLILSSTLIVVGFQVMILGFVADLINSNTLVLDDIRCRLGK